MANTDGARKIAFNLYPTEEIGDKLASDLLDETRLKERGRTMRAFLLTGAALAAIDRRIPNLIAELATKDITIRDIQRIISSVIPDAFSPDDAMVETILNRLGQSVTAEQRKGFKSEPTKSEEDINVIKTRSNSNSMFPDDD